MVSGYFSPLIAAFISTEMHVDTTIVVIIAPVSAAPGGGRAVQCSPLTPTQPSCLIKCFTLSSCLHRGLKKDRCFFESTCAAPACLYFTSRRSPKGRFLICYIRWKCAIVCRWCQEWLHGPEGRCRFSVTRGHSPGPHFIPHSLLGN